MSGDAQALATRAVNFQSSGQFQDAAKAYTELLKLLPKDVATHVNLGVVLVNLGRFDEAIEQYKQADMLLPGDPRIQLDEALAYEKGGRLPEAEKLFAKLHAANPAETKFTVLLADCESQLGADEQVIELLQPLQSADGAEAATAYMLGTALLHKGRVEEGERVLDPMLRNGNSPEAHFLLGVKAFESGDYPLAVKELSGAVALNSKLPQLQSLYGRALLNTGDSEAAADAFGKELANGANDYWANLELGQILIVKKQFGQAAPLLQHALLLRNQSFEAKVAYAEALSGVGENAQARSLAESAVTEAPESTEAHRVLQSIYTRLQLPELARTEERKTLLLRQAKAQESPRIGELAPDFTLPSSQTGEDVSLAKFRGKSPVVLIFGSYTCPNFRSSADALKAMAERYATGIPFLVVYIHEAHDTSQWQSTRNQRESIQLVSARNYVEKREHATMCTRKLHLPFPMLVDGMDGKVEELYRAWPSRAFVIGIDGRIAFSSRLTELEFQPAVMEAVLKKLDRRTDSIGKPGVQ